MDKLRMRANLWFLPEKVTLKLLSRIVAFFPRNGSMVRKYIKKAGFSLNPQFSQFKLSEDEVCFYLLDKYFPKTKETAYLYEGFPADIEKTVREKMSKKSTNQSGGYRRSQRPSRLESRRSMCVATNPL
ncbi:MAG: hypothetical protein LBR07_09640 [Puniceicoccales bacterium]|nr:hypothetical protein [Puniceicoccales bacterium]